MSTQEAPSGPDPSEGRDPNAQPNESPTETQPDPATGQSARDWQARYDKAQERVKQLEKWESALKRHHDDPDFIAKWIDEQLTKGQPPKSGGNQEEEDFRSDEEKRLDDIDKRDAEREQRYQLEMAELRFERAENELTEWAGDLWGPYKDKMMEQVTALAKNGLLKDPSRINPAMLRRVFLSVLSDGDQDEMKAVLTKLVGRWEGARNEREERLGTGAPETGRPGTAAPRRPKSFAESFQLGTGRAVPARE